jgi:membrane protease YdiL (CAAX protease family)
MGIRPLKLSEPPERSQLTESNALPPFIPRKTVLFFGLSLEGALFAASLVWAWWRGMNWSLALGHSEISIFVSCLLVLAALNFLCFSPNPPWSWKAEFSQFLNLFVLPLVRDLSLASALVLALFSGVAEELFFRGVLLTELTRLLGSAALAHLLSALVFALVHFGMSAVQFPRVVVVYLIAGLALGASLHLSESLAVPMAAHVVYNFGAFAVLTKGFRSSVTAPRM